MAKTSEIRAINAPVEKVFETVAHIENFSEAIPHITNVEMLSDVKRGVGAKFRETRVIKGKEGKATLEVTEYVENERVRFVSDEGGVIWDSVFTFTPEGEGSTIALEMEAKPYKFMSRLMTPIVMGIVSKAVASDMDAIKTYCEDE